MLSDAFEHTFNFIDKVPNSVFQILDAEKDILHVFFACADDKHPCTHYSFGATNGSLISEDPVQFNFSDLAYLNKGILAKGKLWFIGTVKNIRASTGILCETDSLLACTGFSNSTYLS